MSIHMLTFDLKGVTDYATFFTSFQPGRRLVFRLSLILYPIKAKSVFDFTIGIDTPVT